MLSFELPADLADAFEARRRGPTTVVVRRDFGDAFDDRGLGRSPERPSDASMLGGGRGATWTATAPGVGEFVVRPGRRGGWPGKFVRSRYLRGHRFLDELVLTERLRRRGAPVPEALAAVQRSRAVGYETWLVTRRSAARPLARVIAELDESEAAGAMEAAGRLIGAFHGAGGKHADLNAHNVLVPDAVGGGSGLVIDLDRGDMSPVGTWGDVNEAELRRLRRSLAKLGLAAGLAAWDHFERGYTSGAPDPSAASGESRGSTAP
jgi:3-deoxy-D-manno-octulosonic acid kinase